MPFGKKETEELNHRYTLMGTDEQGHQSVGIRVIRGCWFAHEPRKTRTTPKGSTDEPKSFSAYSVRSAVIPGFGALGGVRGVMAGFPFMRDCGPERLTEYEKTRVFFGGGLVEPGGPDRGLRAFDGTEAEVNGRGRPAHSRTAVTGIVTPTRLVVGLQSTARLRT